MKFAKLFTMMALLSGYVTVHAGTGAGAKSPQKSKGGYAIVTTEGAYIFVPKPARREWGPPSPRSSRRQPMRLPRTAKITG
ncbi:MAG: hypothetical protein HC902_00530 [Calothrix sp. SM1_5_4]|nr:hypothetical protein [Calothrix sp. SM1_5_4]